MPKIRAQELKNDAIVERLEVLELRTVIEHHKRHDFAVAKTGFRPMLAFRRAAIGHKIGLPFRPDLLAKVVKFAKSLHEPIEHAGLHTLCWFGSLESLKIHKTVIPSNPITRVTVRMRAMTAKAARNSRSKTSVSLTLAAVAQQATGTPVPSTATWYLVPHLARSVGFGPIRSPPRLACTEPVSRIRSGWPRRMPTSMAWTCASTPVSAQPAKLRRRVAPLACTSGGDQAAPRRALAQK